MQVQHHDIPGTTIFDGEQAQKGYALNRMCYSFNSAENRAAFLKDEDGYCAKFGLNAQQREAIRERDVLIAGRTLQLTDNKQVKVSEELTSVRFVIPVAQRKKK